MNTSKKSKAIRLSEQVEKHVSRERVLLSRNFHYGGAATSVIILLGLSAMKIEDTSLYIASLADAIALPFFILVGTIHDWYYSLGKKSYPHLRLMHVRVMMAIMVLIPCIALSAAVGALFWHVLPDAMWLFLAGSVVSILLSNLFIYSLDNWWDGRTPSKEGDIEVK